MTLTDRINLLLKKAIKDEKKMTQVELAQKMGVAPASVNKWMDGGAPSVDKLPRLCELLEISPNQLFGYEKDDLPQEAIDLYRAFIKFPEYQTSIRKLLSMVYRDIETASFHEPEGLCTQ